jgi:hypothetical protein
LAIAAALHGKPPVRFARAPQRGAALALCIATRQNLLFLPAGRGRAVNGSGGRKPKLC